MIIEKENLPDDPELLKKMLADLAKKYNHEKQKNDYLEEKYKHLQRILFGKRSEKLPVEDEDQMRLFDEAEEVEYESSKTSKPVQVKSHYRKKRGRRPLPVELPREEIIHDLTEAEKKCPCCGKERPVIGEETTEELDIIPPKIIVNKHIRKKYGPCNCDNFLNEEIPEVKIAGRPPRLIPQSIASSGLIAYTVTAKFCDALPFYRQSKIFQRLDIDLSRATLCNWAIKAAEKCKPLIDLLIEEIRSGPVARMDETPLQVLKEPEKTSESKSYMWVTMGYTAEEKPLLLYHYNPSRSGEIPKEILGNFKGFLQTDGYDGYNKIVRTNELIHVGCFAHVRREFDKAKKHSKKDSIGQKGLKYIQKLYIIENELRAQNLTPDIFVDKRKEAVEPVLKEFHSWLLVQNERILPQGYAGKAIRYTLNEWDKLIKYTDHYLLTPDNNLVENAIRPFVVGRKNWLFSNTPGGASSSAVLYSLVESAKANNLEPYKYLRYLFDHLPQAETREELRSLLPDKITPDMIEI